MYVRLVVTGAALAAAGLGAAPALAQACDPYSQKCIDINSCETDPELSSRYSETTTQTRDAQGNAVTTTTVVDGCKTYSKSVPSTLPFTGGELVTMTAVGLGTLVGGTALVVAGRRRRPAQDA